VLEVSGIVDPQNWYLIMRIILSKRRRIILQKSLLTRRLFFLEGQKMDERIGVIGIVIEELESAGRVNETLHELAGIIVGRMGIPRPERGLSIISLIVEGTSFFSV